jgi:diguanylate cyclase (GGDEF)-like protein
VVNENRSSGGTSLPGVSSLKPARASLPSVPEMHQPAFLDEACTMEVFIRNGEATTQPAIAGLGERALLLRMDGVHAGSVIAVDQLPCTIGRHPTNKLRIDEESMSRFHARISRDEEGFWVEDLESRNGTFVAGERGRRHRLRDGAWITFGAQVSFRFTVTDTREEHLLRRMYESSTRDALTSAYNRSHFDDRLRSEIAFAARHKTEASLVMLDIDHFKKVNDSHGHPAGDLVLKELVRLAQRSLRAEDVFARYGGEEFGIILRGIHLRGAGRLGERLRAALEATPIDVGGQSIRVTLSAGCASVLCCSVASPEEIVRVADRRLYLAKTGGRNRVIYNG